MKAIVVSLLIIACLALPAASLAADPAVAELLKEIKELKARVAGLEKQLAGHQARTEEASQAAAQAQQMAQQAQQEAQLVHKTLLGTEAGSIKASREAETAPRPKEGLVTAAGKKLSVHGHLKVEGVYSRTQPGSGPSQSDSRFQVRTAEIFFTGQINPYLQGVLHFLYEEGFSGVEMDEAFLLLGRTGDMPFYALAGRIYPAVGLFETYLVTDPVTKQVFETRQAALELGYAGRWLLASLGGYNAGVHEAGDGGDSNLNSFYARADLVTPEGALGGLKLRLGAAYTSNIADSKFLVDQVPGQTLASLVSALSVNASASYGLWAFTGEYIAAGEFNPGELSFAPAGVRPQPYAFNLELAFMPWDKWTFAVRYEGGGDLYAQQPERAWGGAVTWQFLPDTTLAVEYMRGEFMDGATRDLVTTQIGVAF
ncbi:MAG: LbtU family siderophore porin [Desulfarculus sp.]|nr:MAG: LbtU family siderophore porin [Desulfarculus sp.]